VFLQALRIENFRAIRKAMINFDDGTALIGENDCGISSVLDALVLALGWEKEPETYPAWLFHHEPGSASPAGPIRLQLRFRERRNGEWADSVHAPLSAVLPSRTDRQRELWYEMSIQAGQGENTRAGIRLRSPGSKIKSSDPDLIQLIRHLNPVIRVSAGMLTRDSPARASISDQTLTMEYLRLSA
jgi:predicted ATP-dependent endonuclease of OLD family